MRKPVLLLLVIAGATSLFSYTARAHWCSNIYQTFARIVVKPERQTINLGVGESGDLRVRVRNNFPYTLYYIKMRANPPPELSVSVTPSESEAEQKRIYPGQEATFVLHITRNAAGSDSVDVLGLEVAVKISNLGGSWWGLDHQWIDQNVTESEVRSWLQNSSQVQQTRALNYALLASLGCAGCETDGVQGLLNLWDNVPSDFENQTGEQTIRAGHQLAVRMRFLGFNEWDRAQVVSHMIARMDHPNDIVRGLAAFFAAYGGSDAGIPERIDQMATSDSSQSARRMARAAQLLLGLSTEADVRDCLNDAGENRRARMTCAAALGIMGDDGPVVDYLIPQASDGLNQIDYPRLLGAYLLQLVVFYRRGGPDGTGTVSFLDEEPVQPDTVAPQPPANLTVRVVN